MDFIYHLIFLFYPNPLLIHSGLHSIQPSFMRSYTGAVATGSYATMKVLSSIKFLNAFLLFLPNNFYEFLHLLSFMKSSSNQLQLLVLLPLVKLD